MVLKRAAELKLILEEKLGSRKNRISGLIALNKLFVIKNLRQQRLPLIIVSNDAKIYYDRIAI